jgi:hypothetical protein
MVVRHRVPLTFSPTELLKRGDETSEAGAKRQRDNVKRTIAAVESYFRYSLATLYVYGEERCKRIVATRRARSSS